MYKLRELESKDSKDNISDYIIRRADNITEIDEVIKSCDKAFDIPIRERDYYRNILHKLDEYADVFFAYNTKILGYIAFYSNNSDYSYISLIAVNPENQHQHIGKKLLEYCEKISREKGIGNIRLEVKKKNINAIKFYQINGFEDMKEKDEMSYYMNKKL